MTELLRVLSSALFGSPLGISLNKEQAAALLQEAERQTVTGLAFDVLARNNVQLPKETVYQYFSQTEQIKQQNALMDNAVGTLARLLEKHGLHYAVVKGQTVGQYYPRPEFRQSGDVDFYCDEESFEKVCCLLEEKWGVSYEREAAHHHIEFERNGVLFEQHSRLIKLYGRYQDAYWGRLMAEDTPTKVDIGGYGVATLSPTLHSLYVFLHLYHHLMELGVGLRQFCDWAMLLHACKGKIDHEALRRHLHELGMEQAYRACGSILVENLGLPNEEFTFSMDGRDRSFGRKILEVVAYRGNMGKYYKRHQQQGMSHNMEATGIKMAHFSKFMPLAPAYSCRWLTHEMKRKISNKLFSR